MIDRDSERPYYHQVADAIRDQLDNGRYPPGTRLPSRRELAKAHGCGIDAITAAVRVLACEGRVTVLPRVGTEVNDHGPASVAYERAPVRVSARMPSEPERREHGWPLGMPLIVVERTVSSEDEPAKIREYPAYHTTIEITA